MFGITFEEREREIGVRLFEDGHVRMEPADDAEFHEACVTHFNRGFWVWARFTGNSIEHECDCPLFEDDQIGCEHLYALLLTLSQSQQLDTETTPPTEAALSIQYCLLADASESAGAPVIQLMDDEGQPLTMEAENWQRVEDTNDINALSMIGRACGGLRSARQGGGFLQHRGPFTLAGQETTEILHALVLTQRLRVLKSGSQELTAPLKPRFGRGRQFHLHVRDVTNSHAEISAVLMDPSGHKQSIDDAELVVSGSSSFMVADGLLSPIDADEAIDLLGQFRTDGPRRIRNEQVEPLLAQIGSNQALPIVLNESAAGGAASSRPQAECKGVIHIDRRGDITALRLTFGYGALEIPANSKSTRPFDPATRKQIERNAMIESACIESVARAGASPDADIDGLFWIDTNSLSNTVSALQDAGLHVFIDRRPIRRGGEFAIDISTTDSALSVALRLPGKPDALPLSTLLASWRTRQDAVLLDDGTALVPDDSMKERLDRFLQLEELALDSTNDCALQFRLESALLLDSLLPCNMAVHDEKFAGIVESLECDAGHESIDVTTVDVLADLRPYQTTGVNFLSRLHQLGLGGCLADDMGLGKTLQILTHLMLRRHIDQNAIHLVVVPRSLLFNWRREAETFTPTLSLHTYHGPKRSLSTIEPSTVVLTTYGVLLRDQSRLANLTFDVCIFDEAQALKNPTAKTTRAAHEITATQKITLTGTPLENSVRDLWSLMDITNPGLFGGKRGFDRLNMADDSARNAVRRALRPVLLRRTKQEVLPDLPPLIEQTLLVEMSSEQQSLYDELRGSVAAAQGQVADSENRSALMLEALLRLRQMACHPRLILKDSNAPSGKIEVLTSHLHELNGEGRKSLVFSQFTSLLDIVGDELDAQSISWVRLDGSTQNRSEVVEQFQSDSNLSVFLISLKAGGTGLNLTAADCVFILDPWWNPASEAQASARAHRIGQQNSVFVQRIISRGTVEEAIMTLKGSKQELSDALVQGGQGAASLNADDLRALLQPNLP